MEGLFLALVLDDGLPGALHGGLVGPDGDAHHRLLHLCAQGEEVARLRPIGRGGGHGGGRSVDEVAHGGGHAARGEGIDVRGRAAETRPVEQVGGLGAVPLVGRKGREHGKRTAARD